MMAWVGIGNKKADRITQSTVAAFLFCFRIVSPKMVGNAGPYAIYQRTTFLTDFSRCPIQCDLVKMLESRGHEGMQHGVFNTPVRASGPGPIGPGGDSAISFVPLLGHVCWPTLYHSRAFMSLSIVKHFAKRVLAI
jgi:hypothetical protein